MVILITGGARSGKSFFAEKYAAHLGTEGIYVATAEIIDKEMKQRVKLHADRRSKSLFIWDTIEEPYDLANRLQEISSTKMGDHGVGSRQIGESQKQQTNQRQGRQVVVLVDCLTIWLSNWLLRFEADYALEKVTEKLTELIKTLVTFQGQILLVTNEVGSSIVPEYPLGRLYRDLAGIMNQRVAEVSQQVFLVTAGIPLELKSNGFKFGK